MRYSPASSFAILLSYQGLAWSVSGLHPVSVGCLGSHRGAEWGQGGRLCREDEWELGCRLSKANPGRATFSSPKDPAVKRRNVKFHSARVDSAGSTVSLNPSPGKEDPGLPPAGPLLVRIQAPEEAAAEPAAPELCF